MKFNKVLENIKTYEAGKPIELVVREFGIAPEDVVKLASNENPIGTSPAVAQAIRENADRAHLYPDDSMFELKAALGEKYGVKDENIIIGAGSDQVLEFISRALLNENESVLMSAVTFAMYEIYAKQMGAKIYRTASWEHKYDEFMEAYHMHKPKIVYICTPNNPTGDATSKEEVLKIIEAISKETLVVVDGAYMEYAAAKDARYAIAPNDLLGYENVIYLGTFSKAYGLAGLRVGIVIAQPDIISRPLHIVWPAIYPATQPLHSPVGAFLYCWLISLFFRSDQRKSVFFLLFGGSLLHFFLDIFQKHLVGGYLWLFPFSLKPFSFGYFWPEDALLVLPYTILIVLIVFLISAWRKKR